MESLRPDAVTMVHQGRTVMPTLQGLADSGLLFTRVWAASTHSDYSDVSALSSTYPLRSGRHHYYRKEDPWPRPVIWDALARAGYRNALVSAQNEGWGGMANFLESDGLDYFWDSRSAVREGLPTHTASGDEGFERAVFGGLRAGKVDDSVVVDRAISWMKAQVGQQQPFFLAMNLQSSHFPYELGPEAVRPYEPWVFDFEPSFTWYPEASVETARNAYFNALTYVDLQIARLLEQLDHLGIADDTMIVVYGENGEAFHEHGQVTHASAPFEAGLRVPIVITGAGIRPGEVSYPTSLVDLPPTVLGLLGIPASSDWQGLNVLDEDIPASERVLYFHNENPISRADGLIVGGRWKLWSDRGEGRIHRYDLLQDPDELHALRGFDDGLDQRLESTLREFRCRQLRYYEHPALPLYYGLPPVVSRLPLGR
ncbi:MAG: sulfatase-like hydrolase/transferase [Thermoanaerobaculia bacterium]|nr:sulfatase-like hydrolase/transferase [Thermoanaerobaculia bacterium]